MSKLIQGKATRGSQKWLQVLVNEHPRIIDEELARQINLADGCNVHWLSPLEADGYAEYQDEAFLKQLEAPLAKAPLKSFWPTRGPVWDGLARTDRSDLILVEAKSHISELNTSPTRATAEPLARIQQSLGQTKNWLGSHAPGNWSTCFYQYTNRLAHLYLLRELNKLPAYLLFVYFVNDSEMKGPTSQAEWEGAIKLMNSFLGLRPRRLSGCVLHAFVDVQDLV